MRPDTALTIITGLARPHRGGHRCTNGDWYNDAVGTRKPCPVAAALTTLRGEVKGLHEQIHDAAHDDDTALLVGLAAAGFTHDDLQRLDADDRQGFLSMGRYAVEALAAHLDRDPVREARTQAVRDRLAATRAAGPAA